MVGHIQGHRQSCCQWLTEVPQSTSHHMTRLYSQIILCDGLTLILGEKKCLCHRFCPLCAPYSRRGRAGKNQWCRTGTVQGSGQRSWTHELLENDCTYSFVNLFLLIQGRLFFHTGRNECPISIYCGTPFICFYHVFSSLFFFLFIISAFELYFFSVHPDRSKIFILLLPLC